jgi:RNA polymerase sigma factor (sigma-70 family)
MAQRQRSPVLRYLHEVLGREPPGSPTDADLLERFLARRDQAAFELLVWRHGRMVLSVCRRLLRDPQDAEDAFQSTFLVLVRKARSIRRREAVAGWLYQVAHRCALKARARLQCRNRYSQSEEDLTSLAAPDDGLAAAEYGDVWPLLDEEVRRLPAKYRDPFVLCCLEGKTYAEAGRQLCCPRTTVSTRLGRARAILRGRLAARGVALSAGAFATMLCAQSAGAAAPGALVDATVQAASRFAAGEALTGLSAEVAAVTGGVLRSMTLNNLKWISMLLITAGVLGAGASFTRHVPAAGQPAAADRPAGTPGPPAAPVTRSLPHKVLVYSLAFAPDGKTVATGSHDHTIHLWDVDSGRHRRELLGQRGEVCGLAFAPDGKLLASAGHDNVVRIWDTATGKEVRQCVGHAVVGMALAFAPDGKTLATGGHVGDSTIRLWDVSNGKELHRLTGHQDEVCALAFSPDGRLLASAGADRTVRLWDVSAGKELCRCAAPADKLFLVTCLAFSPDGRTLAASSWLKTIYLWEAATGQERRQLQGHPDGVQAVAFAADGRTLVSSGWDKSLRFWEPHAGKVIHQCQAQGTLEILALRPGHRVLGAFHTAETAFIWDATVARPGGPPKAKPLSARDREGLWNDLAGPDAGVAYRAVGTLAADGERSVTFFRNHLRPVVPGDPQRIAGLIADLDSARFETRRQAMVELEKLGASAEIPLRGALKSPASLEVRRRVEELLAKLQGWSPQRLRILRALEALELMDCPGAQVLLRELAGGAPDAWLTCEARAARERSAGRRK